MLRSVRAALVLAAAASLSLTGCGLMTPITTQQAYAPSDGVRVALSEDVRVENLLVLTPGEEEPAVLIGMLVNDHRTEPVRIALTDAEGTELVTEEIPAHEVVNLNDEPVGLPGEAAVPGATVPVTVVADGVGATTAQVPVLDGTLPEYEQYMEDLGEVEPAAGEDASADAEATPGASPTTTDR